METREENKIYNPYKSRSTRKKPRTKELKLKPNDVQLGNEISKNLRPSSARRKPKTQSGKKQGAYGTGIVNSKRSNRSSVNGEESSQKTSQRGTSKERKSSATKNKFFTSLGSLAGTIFSRKESLDVEKMANEKAGSILNGSRRDSTKPSGKRVK